jgi:hypothetical protein
LSRLTGRVALLQQEDERGLEILDRGAAADDGRLELGSAIGEIQELLIEQDGSAELAHLSIQLERTGP